MSTTRIEPLFASARRTSGSAAPRGRARRPAGGCAAAGPRIRSFSGLLSGTGPPGRRRCRTAGARGRLVCSPARGGTSAGDGRRRPRARCPRDCPVPIFARVGGAPCPKGPAPSSSVGAQRGAPHAGAPAEAATLRAPRPGSRRTSLPTPEVYQTDGPGPTQRQLFPASRPAPSINSLLPGWPEPSRTRAGRSASSGF